MLGKWFHKNGLLTSLEIGMADSILHLFGGKT